MWAKHTGQRAMGREERAGPRGLRAGGGGDGKVSLEARFLPGWREEPEQDHQAAAGCKRRGQEGEGRKRRQEGAGAEGTGSSPRMDLALATI